MAYRVTLCLVLIATQSRCTENHFTSTSVSAATEEDSLIQIGEKQFPNPCKSKSSNCPSGKECTVQYTPRLLNIPIAHCVESNSNTSEGICSEYTVGTNILHCKSEEEWNNTSALQCYLRSIQRTKLVSTKVEHPCPDMRGTGGLKFLTASFNCCTDNVHTDNVHTDNVHTTTDITSNINNNNAEGEPQRKHLHVIEVCFGIALLLSLILMTAAIATRYRHVKVKRHQSTTCVKTLINPEVYTDYVLDSNDKTVLIKAE